MRLLLSSVLLVFLASAAVAAESDPIEAEVVRATTLQVSATVTSEVAARLQPGDQILLSECSRRWCSVAVASETDEVVHLGFVRSAHVSPLHGQPLPTFASTTRYMRSDVNQVMVLHPREYAAVVGDNRRPNEDLPLLNSGPDYSNTSGPPPQID